MGMASLLVILFSATAAAAAFWNAHLTRRMREDQRRVVRDDRLVKLAEWVTRAGENCTTQGYNALYSETSRACLGGVLALIKREDEDLFESLKYCQELRDLASNEEAEQVMKKALAEVIAVSSQPE